MEIPDLDELLEPTDTFAQQKRREELPDIEESVGEDASGDAT